MLIKNTNLSAIADNAMIATSQPLASEAELRMFKLGGNAIDAALAAAIALTVVEPTSNGIGGDAFAIVWDGESLQGLNASGKSPQSLTLDHPALGDKRSMPKYGWLPVTVPGAPQAWKDLHQRYGKLSLAQIFEPAIDYAENGFAVSQVVAINWHKAVKTFTNNNDPACFNWMSTFTNVGFGPQAGQSWHFPDHANTLKRLVNQGISDFYSGSIAQQIINFSLITGGLLSADDLARHENHWVEPISSNYKGFDVYELPPNGQGLATLMALSIFEYQESSFPPARGNYLHHQIEAMKLACADVYQYVTDPSAFPGVEDFLLEPEYIKARANLITNQAGDPRYGTPPKGGTIYLCAADSDGMMISFIQSNYDGFGSGVVIPETGIAMQNRGACFSLDSAHPNRLAPLKRPFHTIIPGFIMKGNVPIGPFGVMGGFMQPQGHLQVICAMIDAGLDPQSALDMPRWRILKDKQLAMEFGFDDKTIKNLLSRGHEINIENDVTGFGRGQIILKHQGRFVGGSDRRADGLALGY